MRAESIDRPINARCTRVPDATYGLTCLRSHRTYVQSYGYVLHWPPVAARCGAHIGLILAACAMSTCGLDRRLCHPERMFVHVWRLFAYPSARCLCHVSAVLVRLDTWAYIRWTMGTQQYIWTFQTPIKVSYKTYI